MNRLSIWALPALLACSVSSCVDDPLTPSTDPVLKKRGDVVVASEALDPLPAVGKSIFFDQGLSREGNQACAACHGPEVGFTGPISDLNAHGAVYEGSVAGRFGNRKPPSAAYATPSPILHWLLEKRDILFVGGNFWDGRATGELLGNPAADQALGPFLNPLEQALPDNACVVHRVCTGSYGADFEQAWGADACAISWPADVMTQCTTEGGSVSLSAGDRSRVEATYGLVGLSIAAYEASPEVNAYTSKYDAFLMGMTKLTRKEKMGLQMFKAKGKCAACHVLDAGPNGEPPLLTDFTFDNLGVPRNPENPWYSSAFNASGSAWVDEGLGGFLSTRVEYASYAEDNQGKQKVPTLRNVAKAPSAGFVKAYTHNGYFKTLEGIVHFYNTRDVKDICPGDFTEAEALAADCWPAPEVEENVNHDELGNLHLTAAQEAAIVAFLKTLTDGYVVP
jgi:cytochrome c peroxidase